MVNTFGIKRTFTQALLPCLLLFAVAALVTGVGERSSPSLAAATLALQRQAMYLQTLLRGISESRLSERAADAAAIASAALEAFDNGHRQLLNSLRDARLSAALRGDIEPRWQALRRDAQRLLQRRGEVLADPPWVQRHGAFLVDGDGLLRSLQALARRAELRAGERARQATYWIIGGLGLFLLALSLWLRQVYRRVVLPLNDLRDTMLEVSNGKGELLQRIDRDASTTPLGGESPPRREVAALHHALHSMLSSIRAQLLRLQEVERALRASETRMRGIIDNSLVGIIAIDQNGCISLVNPAAERMFGYPEGSLQGRPLTDLMPERFRAQHPSSVARFLSTGENRAVGMARELEGQRGDGSVFPLSVSVNALQKDSEHAFVAVLIDLSRERVLHGLVEASERMRQVMERTDDLFIGVDSDWRLVYLNRRAEGLLGTRLRQAVGQDLWRLLPDLASRFYRPLNQAMRDKRETAFAGSLPTLGRRLNIRVYPSSAGLTLHMVDDTERWNSTQSLRRFNRILATSSACQRVLAHAREETALLQSVCDTLVSSGGYRVAWSGLTDAGECGAVRPVAMASDQEGLLPRIHPDEGSSPWAPATRVIETGRPFVRSGLVSVASAEDWQRAAVAHGYQALALLPLAVNGKTIGLLGLCAAEAEAFAAVDLDPLNSLAEELGFAIQALRERQTHERLQRRHGQILEAAGEGIVGLDLQGNVVFANAAALRMLGQTAQAMEGGFFHRLVAHGYANGDPCDWQSCGVQRSLHSGQTVRVRHERFHRADGTALPVAFVSTPTLEDDRPTGGVLVFEDISQRLAAEAAIRERQERVRLLLESTAEAIFGVDLEGRCSFANSSCLRLLGYPSVEHLVGRNMHQLTHHTRGDGSPYPQEACRIYSAYRDEAGVHVTDEQFWRADGSAFPAEYWAYPMHQDGRVVGAVVTFFDITERKRAELERIKLSNAMEQTADAVLITDRSGVIEYVNQAFHRITGYSREEVVGRTPALLCSGVHDEAFYRRMWQALERGEVFQDIFINRRKDGELLHEEQTISPLRDEAGEITHFISTGKDISERIEYQKRLRHMAYHDPLTDLPNRALLLERLEHAISQAGRSGSCISVMLIDLDNFKDINDSLGHSVGDVVLRTVAARLTSVMRGGDTLARLGGDEFMVLAEAFPADAAICSHAQRMLRELSAPIPVEDRHLVVSGSVGIATYPGDGEDAETLLRHADAAMYRAKAQGRDRCEFYTPELTAHYQHRVRLMAELRGALEQTQFVVFYQPQITLRNGAVGAAEALLRWRHPRRGLVSPGEFIPALEESGFIVPVTEWVLCQVCQDWHWLTRQLGMCMRLSVNLSGRQLGQEGFYGAVTGILERYAMDPSYLEFEITETAVMQDPEAAIGILDALRSLGVRIAIDDFGTGYSSLSYLRRLPADTVKVDRSFVRDISTDPEDATLCGTIMEMCQVLGKATVAEGVETLQQQELLRLKGCDLVQGFLYSKAVPLEELASYVKARGDA